MKARLAKRRASYRNKKLHDKKNALHIIKNIQQENEHENNTQIYSNDSYTIIDVIEEIISEEEYNNNQIQNYDDYADKNELEYENKGDIENIVELRIFQPKIPKALQKYVEKNIAQHYLGEMNNECLICKALYFKCEMTTKKVFTKCCSAGATTLNFDFTVPELVQNLLTMKHQYSKHFRENIRQYNSALSFASFGAQTVQQGHGRGPYCFKIQGQIYHETQNLKPTAGCRRQYAQLYIIDTEEAVNERLKHPANKSLKRDLLIELDQLLRSTNKYAQTFNMLHELEENETCDYVIRFLKERNTDPRRYNLPACNEIAVVFSDREGEPPFERDIEIHKKDGDHVKLSLISEHVDPMTYALLYPTGDFGWNPEMKRHNEKSHRLTQSDYYCYLLSVRKNTFASFLHAGKLTQQFVVDAYCKMEANRLHFIRLNQDSLRVEFYQGLYDYVRSECDEENNNDEHAVGKRIILPSSFTGSPRAMAQKYQDAMSVVTEEGPPDLFVTFTANPKWPEIVNNINEYETTADRPDIVARVFNAKKKVFREDILKNEIFGKIKALVDVTEYQKRGLPHVHMLIFLEDEYKIRTGNDVDRIVCAEIPDRETEPLLYKLIKEKMVHGPCGIGYNLQSVCMKNGRCLQRYPKTFCKETILKDDSFPQYRRRQDGRKITFRKADGTTKYVVDNRFIVPYNKYLTKKYCAHINVEICSTVHSVKYLFLYIEKGFDRAVIVIKSQDEILSYLNSRYVSPVEACCRLYTFPMQFNSHTIVRLAVHLENNQSVCFRQGHELNALEKAQKKDTTLTAWFKLNQRDSNAHQYLYREIPKHYVFHPTGRWEARKTTNSKKVIGRLYNAHVQEGERYFLRLMLLHQRGCTSFQSVRTVENIVYGTYREAASAFGLLQDDTEWNRALEEAAVYQIPRCLRQLFATICVFCNPSDPMTLWKTHLHKLCEDFTKHGLDENAAENKALAHISELLTLNGKRLDDYGLPNVNWSMLENYWQTEDEYDIAREKRLSENMISSLNPQQRIVFNDIMKSVNAEKEYKNVNNLFFINAAAGTGKTYLYKAILHRIRADDNVVIPISWTGISASLLDGGRTVHSVFKLPVPLNETSTCSLRLQSAEASNIKRAQLILWDEITMAPYYALDAIDTFLKELMNEPELPFGGKIMVFGGDLMQTLPVVKHGDRSAIILQTIKYSRYWYAVKEHTLDRNMRVNTDATDYAEWLLKIGRGTLTSEQGLNDDLVEIPNECCVSSSLATQIFGERLYAENYENYMQKAILTPKNVDTFKLNDEVLTKLESSLERTYNSADSIINDDAGKFAQVACDYLHSLTPSGMPPHKLHLKVGAVIMLLRNLNPKKGLCNGTRLLVVDLQRHIIEAKILTGNNANEITFLPRIIMQPIDQELIFQMRRVQFPVRLAFSMTINKAQGQTLEKVGLYLPTPVFGHGQLYVALSRAKSFNDIKIVIRETDEQGKLFDDIDKTYTKNIVYHELFQKL